MAKTINARIINKHDTEANWKKAVNFIPKKGEIILYDIDSTHDSVRVKIGDGTSKVNDLPFSVDDKKFVNFYRISVNDTTLNNFLIGSTNSLTINNIGTDADVIILNSANADRVMLINCGGKSGAATYRSILYPDWTYLELTLSSGQNSGTLKKVKLMSVENTVLTINI